MREFVKQLRYNCHNSSSHVFKAPHYTSFLCLPSSVTNHLNSTHTSIYFPLPVFPSHWCIIRADRCCFSAWISSSFAWMNSYQIKAGTHWVWPPCIYHPTPGSLRSSHPPLLLTDTSPSIRLLTFRLLLSSERPCWVLRCFSVMSWGGSLQDLMYKLTKVLNVFWSCKDIPVLSLTRGV